VGALDLPIPCAPNAEAMVLPNVPAVLRAVRKVMAAQ